MLSSLRQGQQPLLATLRAVRPSIYPTFSALTVTRSNQHRPLQRWASTTTTGMPKKTQETKETTPKATPKGTDIFEARMSEAYDMLKDGTDVSAAGLAMSNKGNINSPYPNAANAAKDKGSAALSGGMQAATQAAGNASKTLATASLKGTFETAATSATAMASTTEPHKHLHGRAGYDMLELMEEAQDHPAEFNHLCDSEKMMFGNDKKLCEMVTTWSKDVNQNDNSSLTHELSMAAGTVGQSRKPLDKFDGSMLNALMDEVEDSGAIIGEDTKQMFKRKQHMRV